MQRNFQRFSAVCAPFSRLPWLQDRRARQVESVEKAAAPSGCGVSREMWLWPAWAALLVAAGASLYALAHFLEFGTWIRPLLGTLLLAGAVAGGTESRWRLVRGVCRSLRWPLVVGLLLLSLSARFSWLSPHEEGNSLMALILGWMTLTSVALVGAAPGARRLPLRAPLVPGLSLLGLLSLLSVDTVMQICFIVFAAASIYLGCYERALPLYAPPPPRKSSEKSLQYGANLALVAAVPVQPVTAARRLWQRWFWLSGLVGGAWFVALMALGALLYSPLEAYLPRFTSLETTRSQSVVTDSLFHYSSSDGYMELRGGDNPLSERVVMNVTTRSGEGSGLWRGRTYEHYTRSRWEDRGEPVNLIPLRRDSGRWRRQRQFDPDTKPIKPALGRREEVVEEVEWLGDAPTTFYASGEPLLWSRLASQRESLRQDSPAASWNDLGRNLWRYEVKSLIIRPNSQTLSSLPGQKLPPETLEELQPNLQLPDDASTRLTLQTIARRIGAGPNGAGPNGVPQTPHDKVRAINAYLSRTCAYSLSSPVVPPTEDGAVFFLTQSRVGACDMFASSMTLLLRSLDVPARVATGYLRTENPSKRVTVVRERDAHAWVEYYVPQLGWLSFDPTASTRSVEVSVSPLAQLVPSLDVPIASLFLPAAGLFLLFLGALWPNLEKRFDARANVDAETALRRHIAAIYAQAQRDLKRRVPGAPHLTPREYEDLVSRARLPLDAKQEFAALTHLFVAARYGEVPLVAASEVEGCLKRFKRALKSRK